MKKSIIVLIIIGLIGIFIYKRQDTSIHHYNTNVVVLDAGHGESDNGAVNGIYKEKDINLNAVKLLGNYLQNQGVEVIYTRDSDKRLDDEDRMNDLKLRARMSRENEARYFVSIHVNDTNNNKKVSGFEIYTNQDEYANELASHICSNVKDMNYTLDRGVKDGTDLRVLRLNGSPAILIELGYIKGEDLDYLTDNLRLNKMMQTIGDSIIDQMKINQD